MENDKLEVQAVSQSLTVKTDELNKESTELVNDIITATNQDKQKDLTYLFNINQQKKTAVRQNKLSDLQDKLVDEATRRLMSKPDEIDNKQLFDSMKTIQDLMERNQKQMLGVTDEQKPLIQINQQTNELNINGENAQLDRDSRKRVQDAVNAILAKVKNAEQINTDSENTSEILDAEIIEVEPNNQEEIITPLQENAEDD